MLKDIYLLELRRDLTNETIAKKIILGYSLVHLSSQGENPYKISLAEKIKLVLNEELVLSTQKQKVLKDYKENSRPLSILFLLGVILGDGSFSIRIRDTGKGL